MLVTELHAKILGQSIEKILSTPSTGAVAYIRCLTGDIINALAAVRTFSPLGWQVCFVGDEDDVDLRKISADRAVEYRENKNDPILLMVNTTTAGAGMDGIYSSGREISEKELFHEAIRFAGKHLLHQSSRAHLEFIKKAIKLVKSRKQRISISPWNELDIYVQTAVVNRHPGELLYLIGLWPVFDDSEISIGDSLNTSLYFVTQLLGPSGVDSSPALRIGSLRLLNPTEAQQQDLSDFVYTSNSKPIRHAIEDLADKSHLWVNRLKIESASSQIQALALTPWRIRQGKIAKWSGLIQDADTEMPPKFILRADAERSGEYSKLEIRWKTRPESLPKGSLEYRVAIMTSLDEELVSQDVSHSGNKEEKCRFTNDDFSMLNEDTKLSATIFVSVIGDESIVPQESEEISICYGNPPDQEKSGVGKKHRCFSDGLIELEKWQDITDVVNGVSQIQADDKGFLLLRTRQKNKSFRVFRPPLIRDVERNWCENDGKIGRWRVKVRACGARSSSLEFIPFEMSSDIQIDCWGRAQEASHNFSSYLSQNDAGSVGQIYDEAAKGFKTVKEYLLAWAALLDEKDGSAISLSNTVEVQDLSGRTIGLIVLPSHPLRVAWHAAYDNLIFHARFTENLRNKDIREEFQILDGSMFPAFLPGIDQNGMFVFADTLGFHAVGMILDTNKEPKAAIALLARAIGESEAADSGPTIGKSSARILGQEIIKYLQCHQVSKLLHIHALRPGDGLTIARSLGQVHKHFQEMTDDDEIHEDKPEGSPAFVLELYPSYEQRGISGRFIAEAREKRRSGAGVLASDDQWMLESMNIQEGITIPRLRWSRRDNQHPKSPAHISAAFDTFESNVTTINKANLPIKSPFYGFGLISFFIRQFSIYPEIVWHNYVPSLFDGEKHPSERGHTERLWKINTAVLRSVAHSAGGKDGDMPMLKTVITDIQAEHLKELHQLSDWVITLDRNAGIEYFDSPKGNKEIYDAYVIDCVPEREDMGCLQMITSTSNLDEVRNLVDATLDQMGLSRSLRNAEFLLSHLKALSGRLAIRLTGQKAATGELIALAMVHSNCKDTQNADIWTSLEEGFFIPVDDIRDMLPPLQESQTVENNSNTRPDIIHVSLGLKGAIAFRFIEVKYRRHLRSARNPEDLHHINSQLHGLRERWSNWYLSPDIPGILRALRIAKLARVLRFYADKAYRHYLSGDVYKNFLDEIDKMVIAGKGYVFASVAKGDRGFVFCPEYSGVKPIEISPVGNESRIFLFGPDRLPDSDFRRISMQHYDMKVTSAAEVIGSFNQLSDNEKDAIEKDVEEANDSKMTTNQSGFETSDNEKNVTNQNLTILLGADVLTDEPVIWQPTIRSNPHMLVVGISGMGKTTSLINICRQLHEQQVCPIVFSYHQDIDESLTKIFDNVRFVDCSRLGFNPLQNPAKESRRTYLDVAGEMRDIFQAIYPDLGDIQGECIRKAIKESYLEIGWDRHDASDNNLVEPEFGRFIEILRSDPKPDRSLKTLLSRLEELADYGLFNTIQDSNSSSLWKSQYPIVIQIHTTQNDNLQRAFAYLIFYGFYKGMFYQNIQDHLSHYIIFDEAHRASRLKLIPAMAQECRKYGIGLILASQKAADFNLNLFSLFANYLVLRLTDVDARSIVRNVASSDQERHLIDKIKQMDKYRAVLFSEGRKRPDFINLKS